ncbi:myosin heavy chain, putative [Babesia ovis]|uniref:Myosin heavy chain, putative n=1 Tax=Babesia ovis TaxID=5869 RepID=A0A9W5TBP2_BABOV|nr:myosin heavy chain, putative [Babesia ovis]
MAELLTDSVPLGTGPGVNAEISHGPYGFRVYKRYCHRKRYERDFRRRLRNLKVVELRFADDLRTEDTCSKDAADHVLKRVFANMADIRPQLMDYLRRSPVSLVKRLEDFFGVPISLGSKTKYGGDSISDLPKSGVHHSTDGAPSTVGSADSSSPLLSSLTPALFKTLLETLSHKYETISLLESQVADLTRENTELSMKLSTAYSDISRLDMESAISEQRYLEALTSLTESLHVSATRCSRLQSLVLRQGSRLALHNRALFALENELAKQCHLNMTPYPPFSKTHMNFDADAASSDISNSNYPMIERYFIKDGDCTTSAYDSDGQGSSFGPGIGSSCSVPPGHNIADRSGSFYNGGNVIASFGGDRSSEGSVELVIGHYDDASNRRESIPASRLQQPVITALPELTETASLDGNLKLSSESGVYASRTHPEVPDTVTGGPSDIATATLPLPEVASTGVNSLGPPLNGDTKVRELKTEISVLQKKLQQYLREIRNLKRENERLKPREPISSELRAELATGGVVPFNYRVCEDPVALGSVVPTSSSGNPAILPSHPPQEDTKVKELKAEISVLQKQIQRYQELEEEHQRLLDRLASEERRNRELTQEVTVLRRRMAAYQHEVEQLLRSFGGEGGTSHEHNQSSTAVSQNPDPSSKSGTTMPDLKNVFSSLQERVGCYESENSALRSELDRMRSELLNLQSELSRLRNENDTLSTDVRAVGSLAMDRVLHCVTSAMESMTRTTLEEVETVDFDGTTSSGSTHIGRSQIMDERMATLEAENRLYKDRLCALIELLNQRSFERFQMHTTIATLNSDLHTYHQQLQKFRNQGNELVATSSELERLRAKCSLYDDQVDRLKQMNADLSDLNNRLTDDVRTLEEKSAFSKNEATALREEVRQLQSLLVGDARIAHDAIRDRVTIIQLEGRCNLLNEALSGSRTELESVRGKNSDLVKLVMDLRYALEQERTSNVEYVRQVNAMSETEGRLMNQVDRNEAQLEGLRASVASLTESLEQSTAEVRSVSARLLEKERSERVMASTIETLNGSLQTLLSSLREAKPLRLSSSEMGSVDLSSIANFNPSVYYGLLDAIQQNMVAGHDQKGLKSLAQDVTAAKDKVSNILKCNYLLSALASGLCRQLKDLSSTLVEGVRSQQGSLSALLKCLGDNVNLDLLRAEFANKIGKLHAHTKELTTLVTQLHKSNPAESLNRMKDFYEESMTKQQNKIEQMAAMIKLNEEEHAKLRHENSKLMSDCSNAAKALHEFERRLDQMSNDHSSLCSIALSILPASERNECERDNLRGILSAVRTFVSSLCSYREKYKKLLENPPEPKVITVTAPAPVTAAPTTNPVQPPPVERATESIPPKVDAYTDPRHVSNGMGHNSGRDRYGRRILPNDTNVSSMLKDIDSNVRYYIKNIKSTLQDHVRTLSQADNSDTEYESPRSHSIGRSDATVCDGDDSDSDLEYMKYDTSYGEELLRRHTRQFESICDLLEQIRDIQSHLSDRPSRLVNADAYETQGSRPVSSMSVMHHFQKLCTALKEFTIGTPLALSVDDVFYQLELVMLDQGDHDHRRALWDRCIGNMISVVIDVLRTGSIERQNSLDELHRKYSMAASALEEAQSLCRLREEELHRRTCELSDACNRLDDVERHCRKLEVELELRASDSKRIDDRELRSLQSEVEQREDEVRRLTKEVSKLQSVVLDLEEVNNLLSQQVSRLRSDNEYLGSTVDKQQRQISALNSEISYLELEADRLRRAYT